MALKHRRIYAYTVILFFIFFAPLLVFYTAGYRYNFKEKVIIRTGVLSIDSKPRGAKIILEGKALKTATPAVVKNLIPREYLIKLEKDGYFPWQKKLTVLPNQATLTKEVTLLKKASPSLFVQDNITHFQVSPQGSFLVYLTVSTKNIPQLVVIRLSDQKELKRQSIVGKVRFPFRFSQNEDYLFIPQEKDAKTSYSIIFLKREKESLRLEKISNLNFKKIEEASHSAETIYAQSGGKLYELNLEEETIQFLFEDAIEDFSVMEKTCYYISRGKKNVSLKRADLTGEISSQELLALPNSSHFVLEKNANGILALLDQQKQSLSFIEPKGENTIKFKQLNPSVDGFRWSPDLKKLLFYNDFELWIFNPENEEQELLLRSSEEIQAAEWHPDKTWILFQQADKIKAIETDGRDKRNIVELTENKSKGFEIDIPGKIIFFLNQEKIYELGLE